MVADSTIVMTRRGTEGPVKEGDPTNSVRGAESILALGGWSTGAFYQPLLDNPPLDPGLNDGLRECKILCH